MPGCVRRASLLGVRQFWLVGDNLCVVRSSGGNPGAIPGQRPTKPGEEPDQGQTKKTHLLWVRLPRRTFGNIEDNGCYRSFNLIR